MADQSQSPFNALPPVVVALAVVIGGLEIMFQAATLGLMGGQGGVGWRLAAIQDYGVFQDVWVFMWENGLYPPEQLARFIAYPLIHGGFIHAAFVIVFILAIGKMVAEVFSATAFLTIFGVSAVAGGIAFVLGVDSRFPLIGGYPGVYGLIGAFTFLLWTDLAAKGRNQLQAFSLIGILLAVQILFGVIDGDFGNVIAELSGFATGFALSFVLSPGGWARVLAKLRQR